MCITISVFLEIQFVADWFVYTSITIDGFHLKYLNGNWVKWFIFWSVFECSLDWFSREIVLLRKVESKLDLNLACLLHLWWLLWSLRLQPNQGPSHRNCINFFGRKKVFLGHWNWKKIRFSQKFSLKKLKLITSNCHTVVWFNSWKAWIIAEIMKWEYQRFF